MEIKNSYLMWIGSDHYATFDIWKKEAGELGVSKRLPGADVGRKLCEPGTVIFVAHDEGETHDCPDCTGTIACPECRITEQKIIGLEEEIADLLKPYGGDEDAFHASEDNSKRRSLRVRQENVAEFIDKKASCGLCYGNGEVDDVGTGG